MLSLEKADEDYLMYQLRLGQAVLVLGAGASFSSTNRFGKPVKSGSALARALCENAGLPYDGEPLPIVYEAVRGSRLSDVQIQAILRREYCDSKTLKRKLATPLYIQR